MNIQQILTEHLLVLDIVLGCEGFMVSPEIQGISIIQD